MAAGLGRERPGTGFCIFPAREWSVEERLSSAEHSLVHFAIKSKPAAGFCIFPAREWSVEERVSSAEHSLVHFSMKSKPAAGFCTSALLRIWETYGERQCRLSATFGAKKDKRYLGPRQFWREKRKKIPRTTPILERKRGSLRTPNYI